jgi:hypothetical protein
MLALAEQKYPKFLEGFAGLKLESCQMPKVKGKSNGQDVENPPGRFVPPEILDHGYLQRRCPRV